MVSVVEGAAVGAITGAVYFGIDTARGISNCASGYVWVNPLEAGAATIVHGVPIASPSVEIATKTTTGALLGAYVGCSVGLAVDVSKHYSLQE